MNNQPVPMDVDRTRAPNWRGRGGGPARGRAATTQGPSRGNSNGACFQCGQQGHFARNCPMRQRRDYANLIDFNEDDQEYFGSEPNEEDPVEDIKARLARVMIHPNFSHPPPLLLPHPFLHHRQLSQQLPQQPDQLPHLPQPSDPHRLCR